MTRILGIDPGSQRTGVGIVDSDATGRCVHVFHAPIVLLGADDFPKRLKYYLMNSARSLKNINPKKLPSKKYLWRKILILP